MSYSHEIFREYDIRGVYNEQFDLEFAKLLAKAYVTFAQQRLATQDLHIAIGYDARSSSPDIAKRLAEGLIESGAHVYHLGLVTSPLSYFSTFAIDKINGAFMVTGSHNPPEYNGFKISVGQGTIYGQDIQELKHIIENKDFKHGQGRSQTLDIREQYCQRYKQEFGTIQDIGVVLDCGNGAAGAIVGSLFKSVGLNPTILFEDPDGRFPNHHPDPTVEKNLEDLKQAVKKQGAKVGIGFDGDADRIGVVDHQGHVIWGDELMMIYARDILAEKPGLKVIGDVKCSDRLYDEVKRLGGQPIMWKTGHSLVKQKIKDEQAPFGGELSGHIFFADRNYGYDDAPYAALRLIEIMAKTGKTIPELLDGIPPAFNTPEIRIDTTESKKNQIVDRLRQDLGQGSDDYTVNLIDGIRLSFKDGWALARASNTQPVLVLRFESQSQQGLQKIRDFLEGRIKQIEASL